MFTIIAFLAGVAAGWFLARKFGTKADAVVADVNKDVKS